MVYDIGKIDLSIYQVVTENIQTDEVAQTSTLWTLCAALT
mgnify:CR=1 FL=1